MAVSASEWPQSKIGFARAVTASGSHRCLAGSHASTSPANPARAATGSARICSMRRKIHRQDGQVRADQHTQRRELRLPPDYPAPDRSPAVGHNILVGLG